MDLMFQRKIFEHTFMSNLNQVILDDITRDVAVFVRYVQAVSEYLILFNILYIPRCSHLTRARLVPKVRYGYKIRYPSGLKSFCPTVIKTFKFQWGMSREVNRSTPKINELIHHTGDCLIRYLKLCSHQGD